MKKTESEKILGDILRDKITKGEGNGGREEREVDRQTSR